MQVLLEKIKHNKLCQVVLNDDGSASVICDSEVTYTTGPDFMHDYKMYPPSLEFLLDQESKHYFTRKWLENKASEIRRQVCKST